MMAGPNHGALGMAFKAARVLQAVCMIAIVGMTANFIAQMVSSGASPPDVLVATLSVVCIAVLYCAVTFILYMDNLLPFLVITGLDSLHLIAVIVVAVVVGKPLSYLNCSVIGEITGDSVSAYSFTSALGNSLAKDGGKISYANWIGASKANCLEMKAIWGLTIALCILFALSATCTACLWRKERSALPKNFNEA
ncbi:hypothetical protein VTO42DRAFT_1826 [Malbranchea cinnamomea]